MRNTTGSFSLGIGMKMKTISMKTYTIFVFFLLLTACSDIHQEKKEPTLSLDEIMLNNAYSDDSLSVLIEKSNYTLSVYHMGKRIKSYPVVFGGNPVDDKQMEGDSRTPEGEFGIRDMYPHPKWTKFIWIDYPNQSSWEKFELLRSEGEIPMDASIGGEIGIHGVPPGKDYLIDQKIDWTLGCIAMKNSDLEEVYRHISTKTSILIE